jgi:hypothetical protein
MLDRRVRVQTKPSGPLLERDTTSTAAETLEVSRLRRENEAVA